jgi:L(+)-tartrate dehydratase beta subunit
MVNLEQVKMHERKLQIPITEEDTRALEIGDIVYLNGLIFTGREGLYKKIFDDGYEPPIDIRKMCNVTFHCSPAVSEKNPGEYNIPSVTATASFRFDKYIPKLFERYGVMAVIGKGGMQKEVYQKTFSLYNAVYLTTVGYGLGATYGKSIRRVKNVFWKEELGLAQAMWVLDVKNFGPFLVECDTQGRSLFSEANKEINKTFEKMYDELPQPKLKRLGEVTQPGDEVL